MEEKHQRPDLPASRKLKLEEEASELRVLVVRLRKKASKAASAAENAAQAPQNPNPNPKL